MENNKKYWVMDLQDTNDYHEMTLEQAKDFLRNFFDEDDYDTVEEMEKHEESIENADFEELDELLSGVDYTIFETKEDMDEFATEWNRTA